MLFGSLKAFPVFGRAFCFFFSSKILFNFVWCPIIFSTCRHWEKACIHTCKCSIKEVACVCNPDHHLNSMPRFKGAIELFFFLKSSKTLVYSKWQRSRPTNKKKTHFRDLMHPQDPDLYSLIRFQEGHEKLQLSCSFSLIFTQTVDECECVCVCMCENGNRNNTGIT